MFIHEMTECECRRVLERSTIGRLACARNNQPYVVPIYFAFDGMHLYGFTTLGQKIEWMRTNPHVCLEVDETCSDDEWVSVIVFGLYEELPDMPKYKAARIAAHQLIQRRAMWWEPSYINAGHRDTPHSLIPIFYRIQILRITGHRATPNNIETKNAEAGPATTRKGLWSRIVRRVQSS